jgi:3-oxoisoapionate kinase
MARGGMNDFLFSYYADDFTGSTDALEALAANGVPTVLFLGLPGPNRLKQFTGYRAAGIAGESRSRSPEWMERSLPQIYAWMRSLDTPLCQYKVCSTFDSSPQTGNIAVAMRIGREVFGSRYVPIVVAAPHLRRYVLFGNLFAAAGGDGIYRIDRHPAMRSHPVTPMAESDLRNHLSLQAPGAIGLVDILSLNEGTAEALLDRIVSSGINAVVFDGLDGRTSLETGRLLWARRAEHPFVAGSSGLTHALLRHWREAGLIPPSFEPPGTSPGDRMVVISGSCSPVTESQIRYAMSHGFEGIHTAGREPDDLLCQAADALGRGRNPILYSALGPHNLRGSLTGADLGHYLGNLLRELVTRCGVRRAIIAGGDTATHATAQLGIHALTFASVMAPGAPLCRAHSDSPVMNGLELVLKGGQVGGPGFFEQVLKGL